MRTDDDEPASLRRLYATSLGHLEVGLNIEQSYVFIHLFDADGGVTRNSADEWDQIDVADVLHREIGLSEPESRVIAEKFRVVANSKGHEQPRPMTPIPGILLVGGILVVIAIGLWTIGSWIFG